MPSKTSDIDPFVVPALSSADQAELAQELDAVYEQVPSTCCAGSGECCVLTEQEMGQGYATMFPLYLAEYVRIAEHVRLQVEPGRADQLLGSTEERPRQCPFLGADHGCTIYPVRPLICRTYAVLDPPSIAAAAKEHGNQMPDEWVQGFVRRESAMHCPRVTLMQPDKLAQHVHNLISFTYERTMARLSRKVFAAMPQRRCELVREQTRQRSWPTRWTWGGFNALRHSSSTWVRAHLKSYWKAAQLNDLG